MEESIISDLQEAADKPQYKHLDITETTMKETFTNLILAGETRTSFEQSFEQTNKPALTYSVEQRMPYCNFLLLFVFRYRERQ